MRFRRGLGLNASDEALARAANADNDAEREFGVPLTDDELSELLRRDQVIRDDAPTARKTVVDSFGGHMLSGVWMDNIGGGLLTVAVTGSPQAVREKLAKVVDHPTRLRVVVRPHSIVALEQIVTDLRAAASKDGRNLSGMRLDERTNRIQVATTDDIEETRRWIAETVGAGAPVDVEPGEVAPVGTKSNNSPPLRGGQRIDSLDGWTCTSGFTARGPNGYYVLTAGHCSKADVYWDQVGTPIGIADRSDVTGTDVLRIPVIVGTALTNEVTLAYTTGLDAYARYQTITSSQASSSDFVGQVSCITGQNFSDLRCGEIITRSFDVSVRDSDGRLVSYTNGREVDADCSGGDSGGPALRSGQARGIVSVKVARPTANDTCVYVHIDSAMSQIGVTDVLVAGPVLET
ncbi:trypsin-like serine protease [Nocardioides sp. KC13]|uniref:Trypsin-like serine protease n=1 Tax=Nocardioides turkmenicus TaxID=2711220 RepID=A0A6M1R5I6_9ACTN|nr:S1 family peptidase [Nocardioides sp. KC13]NGN91727.1 trypsin-like serine protease [Nocardioides sp. KC13]